MNYKNYTMKDVAIRAGVSITTVSHVINKTRYVEKDTAKRVLDAIEEFNYHYSVIFVIDNPSTIYVTVFLRDYGLKDAVKCDIIPVETHALKYVALT